MRKMRSQLDRLFARSSEHQTWARDVWSPPWQPRGRWWLRSNGHIHATRGNPAPQRIWRRTARPARVA